VIAQLGYQPSALARSLIRQRSYTLGVATAGLRHIGPSRTLSGIASAAEEAGYSLLLKELPKFNANNITPIIQSFLSRHVDGIIWAVPEVGENHAWVTEQALDIDVPLVYITMEPREGKSVVCIDNYLGGRQAMAHLLEQGYRHIAHLSGPLDWWEARQRKAAWSDALAECGYPVSEAAWEEGNWSSSSAVQPFEKLLDQYPEMDAIFVANDQMALTVIQVAHHRGLRIPEDLGVVGFDNIPESAYFSPPLTTIQQDQYKVAQSAVEEIIQTIELGHQGLEPNDPQTIILPPTLIVRHSSLRG
ncbi:MAG: substrate-binding domain-containing protein, partial [Chloroflexi bacterium]|nr:substrate-binding domain-containing protein [Chloroflexota bacterium]